MPTKKTAKSSSSPDNPAFRGFININLSEEDRAKIKSSPTDEKLLLLTMEGMIKEGYKFSFSWDNYSQCFQVIGTRSAKDHPDYGILLSGRGSSPIKAYKQWLYMVSTYIGEDGWSEAMDGTSRYTVDD